MANKILISGVAIKPLEKDNEFLLWNEKFQNGIGIPVNLNSETIDSIVFGKNGPTLLIEGVLAHDGSSYKIIDADLTIISNKKNMDESLTNTKGIKKKYKINESQLERLLENLSIFPDCNGKQIKRHEIVTYENMRWRVIAFMDNSEVKCVGLDSENNGKEIVIKSDLVNCESSVDETTSIGSVGGGNGFGYDTPFPNIGDKVKRNISEGEFEDDFAGSTHISNKINPIYRKFLPNGGEGEDPNSFERRQVELYVRSVKNKLKEIRKKNINISDKILKLRPYLIKGVKLSELINAIDENPPQSFYKLLGGLDKFSLSDAIEFNKKINGN